MTHLEIILIIALGALAWLWLDSVNAREVGIRAVRTACDAEGLQLLDETIAIVRMKPRRNPEGRMSWHRVYEFEYSDTGDNRRRGSVHLLGQSVTLLNLGPRLVP